MSRNGDMMRILWLTNIEIPIISRHLGNKTEVYGGWLEETANLLLKEPNTSLMILYPSANKKDGNIRNLSFSTFTGKENSDFFYEILKRYNPDVIHVWGTEFKHTLELVDAAKATGYIDNLVISIQGLVSIYAMHYCLGLPSKVINHKTIHELIRGNNIAQGKRDFEIRGKYEASAIKKAVHVIGRTDFDYAATKMINPSIHYHYCNETLRPQFYGSSWNYEKIEPYSIFISQCSYPVKGFHFAVKALNIIKKKYPDAHIYTTGPNILEKNKDILRRGSYHQYISQLIYEYGLEKNISFLGFLDAASMKEQYLKANVVVSPSTIENSSNSIGEAMILGCPVISSDVGGIKVLLEHNKEGLIYQADADYMLAYSVNRVFSDSIFASQLGVSAQKRAYMTHDPEKNYNNLISIYSSIRRN